MVQVIEWGCVKLRINITSVFRISGICSSRTATRAISATSENTSDINPYFYEDPLQLLVNNIGQNYIHSPTCENFLSPLGGVVRVFIFSLVL